MFCIAYQRHQCSKMRIEKESGANGAQRNTTTANLHNLSCKIVSRDSSLTETKDSCNQAQTGPPTRLPNRMLHRETAFTGVFFVHAQHLAIYPSSKHNPKQRSYSKSSQQANNEKLRTAGFKYHVGGLFRKGKYPYQKDLYPYLSSRSLINLLISILRQ